MFEKSVPLFNLFGFKVKADPSWLFIAFLVTWSLAVGFFPYEYRGLRAVTYWSMGICGALGLFVSIIIHEFFHSVVARHFGLPMRGITLFIFGGVAEMEDEPPSAKAEAFMAAAGPFSSFALGSVFYALGVMSAAFAWSDAVSGVIQYLAWVNVFLAAFNLLPAFPLDGGRLLRALLWQWKKNLRWATRVASGTGSAFGLAIIFLGIVSLFFGSLISGFWYVLIGMFLRNAAAASYRHVLLRRVLSREPVSRFMQKDIVKVPPDITVEELIERYVYIYHHKMFPVAADGTLLGCISISDIKKLQRSDWSKYRVRDIASSCSTNNTISPEADAAEAVLVMNRAQRSRLLVVSGTDLVGVVTLKDLLRFFALKLDLEGEESGG